MKLDERDIARHKPGHASADHQTAGAGAQSGIANKQDQPLFPTCLVTINTQFHEMFILQHHLAQPAHSTSQSCRLIPVLRLVFVQSLGRKTASSAILASLDIFGVHLSRKVCPNAADRSTLEAALAR